MHPRLWSQGAWSLDPVSPEAKENSGHPPFSITSSPLQLEQKMKLFHLLMQSLILFLKRKTSLRSEIHLVLLQFSSPVKYVAGGPSPPAK